MAKQPTPPPLTLHEHARTVAKRAVEWANLQGANMGDWDTLSGDFQEALTTTAITHMSMHAALEQENA